MPSALPAGSTVRFRAAHRDGRHGSTWSAQTARDTGDVYLAHREGGRWVHTSLHRDGRWHLAVTPAGQDLVPGAPRYLGVTRHRREIAPGWLHAVRITVAAAELRSGWHEAVRPRKVIDVPLPDGADAISIDVLLGDAEASALHIERALTVATLDRADGGTAAIIARPMELDAPVREALASQIVHAVADARGFGWDGQSTTRIVIFGNDPDGYLRHVEVAVDPDNSAGPRFAG